MTIDLTDDEYDGLLLMLGYAISAATGDPILRRGFLRVTNAVGWSSPNYVPYVVPEPPDALS